MTRRPGGLNPEVARIASEVVGNLTLEQAAIRLDYRPGKEGIRALKKGKVGWEATARDFAEGFWQRFCELYGEEISGRFGECNQRAASDYFAEKCGFGRRYMAVAEPAALTYEADLEDIDVAQYLGDFDLDPRDRRTLNALVRTFLAERRRRPAE